ncbi:hypothetical protein HAX54_023347, partial [Datura stramonium]|nr:hypothetical protein [Datura stramonium]
MARHGNRYLGHDFQAVYFSVMVGSTVHQSSNDLLLGPSLGEKFWAILFMPDGEDDRPS